jgi:hypothetical protein
LKAPAEAGEVAGEVAHHVRVEAGAGRGPGGVGLGEDVRRLRYGLLFCGLLVRFRLRLLAVTFEHHDTEERRDGGRLRFLGPHLDGGKKEESADREECMRLHGLP